MADKNIGALPAITTLSDDALLVAEQQSAAGKITGKQIKDFAKAGVEAYVSSAQQAASDAEASAAEAAESVGQIGTAVEDAQAAKDGAVAAQEAIESLGVSGNTLAAGQAVTVTKTVSADGVVTLTFGIPKGETGEQGPIGQTGATGATGVGVQSATVDASGNLILTLTSGQTVNCGYVVGPQGGKGNKGDTGASIQSVTRTAGTGAAGTTDTYTITMTDGTVGGTFAVYNGQDGQGSGDMSKAVYDPQNKAQDVFAYADEAAAARQAKLTGAAGQVVGFDADGNAVAQAAPDTGVTSFNGRTGAVTPQAGDYTAEQVGALPVAGGTVTGELRIDVPAGGGLAVYNSAEGVYFAKDGVLDQPKLTLAGTENDSYVILDGIAAPQSDNQAANKKYVDDADAGKQDKLTGTQGQVVGFDASGAAVAQAAPSGGDRNWYGVCSTASSAAAKTVNVGDGFVLKTGVRVTVKFLETNNATGPSLNVNGTGAKGITLYGSVYSSEYDWIGGAVETLVYDGTYWVLEGAAPSTLVYRGRTKLQSVPNTSETVAATPNCVLTALNRTNSVNLANTAYTTYMARGEALFATETTPTVNGAIAWQYE